jgi:hypothetical protein
MAHNPKAQRHILTCKSLTASCYVHNMTRMSTSTTQSWASDVSNFSTAGDQTECEVSIPSASTVKEPSTWEATFQSQALPLPRLRRHRMQLHSPLLLLLFPFHAPLSNESEGSRIPAYTVSVLYKTAVAQLVKKYKSNMDAGR